MRYAQIDSNGVCVVVSDLSGEVNAPHMIPIADDENPIGMKWENGEWVELPPVEPEPQLSSPILYAAAQVSVQDGEISGIGINSRFGGAFWGDVGKYYVFFAETQPDTDYIVMASAPALNAYVLDADKTEDMFAITVTDGAGQSADAETVNIQILRAS
jgi:hypothetical protein